MQDIKGKRKVNIKIVTCFLLLSILFIGLYFRTYKLTKLYLFAHDQDLFSWIVKDIVIDHHFRLIGQETSINGIFIGPLFYYLLSPFFLLTKMDPIGSSILITLIGILTVYSFYFVIGKFFGRTAGLISAFLYAVAIPCVFFDRWAVPTQPTILWSIWYLYALLSFLESEHKPWLLVGLLWGIVWHIHIALAPLVLLFPIVFIVKKQKIIWKQVFLALIIFFLVTSPFWIFEFRHGFLQLDGLLSSFNSAKDPAQGFYRLQKVFSQASIYLMGNLFYELKFRYFINFIPFLFFAIYGWKTKAISLKKLLIFFLWVMVVIFSQFFSSRQLSEYYFSNLAVVSLPLSAIFLARFYDILKEKAVVISLLIVFFLFNYHLLIKTGDVPDGYLAKKKAVEFIQKDALAKGFPCISINYITDFGKGVGFRYFFWWKGVPLIEPGRGAPVYNIVIPAAIAAEEINQSFGNLGIILPKQKLFNNQKICNDPKNKLQSLLGFVN